MRLRAAEVWHMLKLLALALLAGAVQAQADPPGRVGRAGVQNRHRRHPL